MEANPVVPFSNLEKSKIAYKEHVDRAIAPEKEVKSRI
jgi:hypothetical protein